MSNSPLDQHFGVGNAGTLDRIRVVWPRTGQETVLTDVASNQFLVIPEP